MLPLLKIFSFSLIFMIVLSGCNVFVSMFGVPDDTDTFSPVPAGEGTSVPTPDSTPGPTSVPTQEPLRPPVISDLGYINNPRPEWTWTTGGGGIGNFRYKLDDPDIETDAVETSALSFTPLFDLSEGEHVLYIQECDSANTWSSMAVSPVVIDFSPPLVDAGKDLTTGTSMVTNAQASDSSGIDTFSWVQLNGPGTVTFLNPSALNTLIDASGDGWYTLQLSVTDKAGNSAQDSFVYVFDSTAEVFYPFNGNPDDASGNERHGSKVNTPSLARDRNGNDNSAYDVTQGYLSLAHGLHPDIASAFTIAGWVKRNSESIDPFQCFLGKDYSKMYGIGIQNSDSRFYIVISGVVFYFNQVTDPIVPADTTWHHFAVAYDDSSDSLALYYDGNFVRSLLCKTPLNTLSTYDLCIGKDGNYADSFQGIIDDIYIYSRILNLAEIQDLYQRP